MLVQINSKGQVTVPQSVRRQLGLKAGDVLELEARGETMVLRLCASESPALRTSPPHLLRSLSGKVSLGGNALQDSEALYDT